MKKILKRRMKWHVVSLGLFLIVGTGLCISSQSAIAYLFMLIPFGCIFFVEWILRITFEKPEEPYCQHIEGKGWCIIKDGKATPMREPDEPPISTMWSWYRIKDKAYYRHELWKAQKEIEKLKKR